ncbi:Abortive infection protein [Rippkaea orientalis PCC 8801]|uniref:Abortive infection protein n=1 Tax=Rippkaea orientalis (strain PCC 8801 / RF-1) TaxID=41431 RepID=B7JUB5_RIPO1|nr:CPBP family intramembrane glutamic endopeptidase [Rippkaea orientalis]ACK64495.1 Abortive infection protein [Rippkaea orientalis PCC 8801]
MFLSQVDSWLSLFVTLPGTVKGFLLLVLWVILWLPLAWLMAKRVQWRPFTPLTPTQKLPMVASLYLVVPLLVWLLVTLEGTSVSDYGLWWRSVFLTSLLWGMGLAIVGLGIVFGVEGWLGWLVWQKQNLPRLGRLLLPLLGLGLWVGITEEVIFRGILLNLLEEDLALWIAAALSSAIFALLHLVWERQETLPQIPGLWLMGMVLVWARLVDGESLGLASGLHAGWVWGLASLDAAELITYTGKGSDWIIGWGKQPLAGLAGIICLLGTGLILWPLFQLIPKQYL